MATQAVSGGKVHCNGGRIKPSREVKLDDEIRIHKEGFECTVIVLGLAEKRGPAKEASLLYRETEASISNRERMSAERLHEYAANLPLAPPKRPGKRDRRLIRSFTGKN